MTGLEHLTNWQKARLDKFLPVGDPNGEVRLAWQVYQRLRAIYHATSAQAGRRLAEQLIKVLHTCPIPEIARLGRTPGPRHSRDSAGQEQVEDGFGVSGVVS